MSSPQDLVQTYCTVEGLESDMGRLMNGQDVYVAKVDPDDASRVGVIFVHTLATPSICRYVSLRPQNLVPKFNVVVKASAICGSAANGGGFGLFATKSFAKGEIIMTEVPFATVPPAEDAEQTAALIAAYHKKLSAPQRDVLSRLTLGAVDDEPSADGKTKKKKGGDTDTADSSNATTISIPNRVRAMGDWAVRLHSNCISTDDGAMHLYPIMCRINHRCMGESGHNAWWRQEDGDNQPRYLTAAKAIAAGEEIRVDYIDSVLLDPFDRHDALARYGIAPCPAGTCVSCNPPYAGGGGSGSGLKTREEGLVLIQRYHDAIGALGAAMAHVVDAPLGSMLTTKEWVQWYESTSIKLMGLTAVFGLNQSRTFELMIGVLYPQGDALFTLIKNGLAQYSAAAASPTTANANADDAANKKEAAAAAAAKEKDQSGEEDAKKSVEVNIADLLKLFSLFKKNVIQRQQLKLEFYGGNAEHPFYLQEKRSGDADLKGAVAEFMRRGIQL